jgi:release factor glutamine methyltransferase
MDDQGPMTLKQIQSVFRNDLKDIYELNEVNSFYYMLLEHHFQYPKHLTALEPDHELKPNEIALMQSALKDLKNQKPIQYIIGETEFFGNTFKVNENVLIPRPETEELVSWMLSSNNDPELQIMDIGTGSGCIAISLAKGLPKAKVHAIDISDEAIELAKSNADLNEVEVRFKKKDILKPRIVEGNKQSVAYDLIVSNPPYVLDQEKKQMSGNVLKHEPHTALFVSNDNPLLFYNKIIEFAIGHLKTDGFLYFEINENMGQEICNLLKTNNFMDIELKQDIYGKDRMIKARKS